ncbi:pyridoxal phosphate-dependent decarboxylase family protein [Actinophytocola oryzae]|uniref:Aromatic-L-amino-acid decarboxylase n=1 Tax=Actinophytocola oryzae TaxID=502181 RepID=A0A4V3FV52_9PSEU|nr:aminotransferase class V-fold PLP-dependent enzyme [Actinophytocola oryzae]TDV57751.1 aromatic-L-amino-acid decarboxylase [Actinophytocola oryzae]
MEPDRQTRQAWTAAATAFVDDFVSGLEDAPASAHDAPVPADLLAPPPEGPGDLADLLARFGDAASRAIETAGPRYFAYFPAGGLYSSALAEFLSQTVNRYTGIAGPAPALAAIEQSVIRWLCDVFDLPAPAGGVFTSGASIATLAALHAAREDRLGGPDPRGTLYVTAQAHYCVAKAARIAGMTADQVRIVPVDADLRLDVPAAAEMIERDRAGGRRPFLLVATAGTTSTGTVDPLAAAGDLARREDLWFHVDGAYGGAFQLTTRGREVLAGITGADSIALDPHKGLFLPFGTGVLLVRDQARLRAAHTATGEYLQDLDRDTWPDAADLGPELTRGYRGLRLWLPLHLHGVDAFRRELDEKLDLSAHVHEALSADPNLEVPLAPDLTVSVFRSPDGDAATARLLSRVNDTRRAYLSSTRLDGRHTIRLCVLSFRTHKSHVDEVLEIIHDAARP